MKCKKHKWRVGSGIGKIRLGKIKKVGLNIWCEECDEVIQAKYEPYDKYPMLKKTKSYLNNKKPNKEVKNG